MVFFQVDGRKELIQKAARMINVDHLDIWQHQSFYAVHSDTDKSEVVRLHDWPRHPMFFDLHVNP